MIEFLIEHLNVEVIVIGLGVSIFLWWKWKKNQQNGRDLLSYIPNVWTSLGILGTFIAIVWSLSKIDGENLNIIDLIKKIIPAFITSIIGIIGAIISSICIKIAFAKEDKVDEEEQNTPEQTLRRIEKALNSNIATTQKQTERITDTLVEQSKILHKFVDDFIKEMDSIFKNMKESIEKQTEAFGKEQYEKTSTIIESIHKNLEKNSTDIIKTHTDKTEKVLKDINKQFETVALEVFQEVKYMRSELSVSITQTVEQLKETYDFIDSKAAQIVTNYDQSALSYKDAVQNAHENNSQISELLISVQQSMKNCDSTNKTVVDTFDFLKERQTNINNLVARIHEMSVTIETLKSLEIQLNKLNNR